MLRKYLMGAVCCAWALGGALSAAVPEQIDFGRDVQPLFKAHCVGCHGPALQMNGFRLDQRRDAMKGGTLTMIGPGNSEASRLYLRLIGNQYGPQMPPTGPLGKEQIEIIKRWIDQGAPWPDGLSGEAPSSPPDPKATRMMEALRNGDRQTDFKISRPSGRPATLRRESC